MNAYKAAMERVSPPEGLEERLLAGMKPPARVKTIRPITLAKKLLLAAALTGLLAICAGSAVLWDDIFTERFGPEAGQTETGQSVFQDVQATAVCGDVTLGVRQALVSDRTVHLILDYTLPETVDMSALEGPEADVAVPNVAWFSTDTVSWPDFETAERETWEGMDWTAQSAVYHLERDFASLRDYRFPGGSSMKVQPADRTGRTLTWMLTYTIDDGTKNLGDGPLTLLVTPPVLEEGERRTALADHPALVTFTPSHSAPVLSRELPLEKGRVRVMLSPLAIQAEAWDLGYDNIGDFYHSIAIRFRDGSQVPVSQLAVGFTGSRSGDHVSADTDFDRLLDLSQVEAVVVNGLELLFPHSVSD